MGYLQPDTVEAVVSHLSSQKDVKIIAGGTDLAVLFRSLGSKPDCLIDISRIADLQGLEVTGAGLCIKAGTTITEIAASKEVPAALRQGAASIGSPQIRNVATIGGNVCNASPCGDTLSPLIALGAQFKLVSSAGEKTVYGEDFFTGPKMTILKPDEVLTEVIIEKKYLQGTSAFKMLGQRNGQAISQVNGAVWLMLDAAIIKEIRISFGSVAPVPVRALHTEAFLQGKELYQKQGNGSYKKLNNKLIIDCLPAIAEDIKPITDVRASATYRYTLAKAIFNDIMLQAAAGSK